MKPPPFDYVPAEGADHAVAVLSELGDDAKVLAGGQSLVPLLSLRLARPTALVDINPATDLGSVGLGDAASDGGVRLGALVRHRTVERSGAIATANPLLAAAARHIGHAAIRNRGTVAGSIAHADPAAELPMLLVALDGTVEARSGRGTRTIPARDLFAGFLTTTLEPDELLTAVIFPALVAGTGWSFQQFSRRSGDFGIVTVAATLRGGRDGRIAEARLAFAGVAPAPVRATAAESAMAGESPSAELWEAAAVTAAQGLDPAGDIHGSPGYRRHLARTLAVRALTEAGQRMEAAA